MENSWLIQGATVVSSQDEQVADVLIENGRIVEVAAHISRTASNHILAKGLHLLPGVLDPQVHFRDPGLTWKEDWNTGSRAAAAGGVTGVFDMPNTEPLATTAEKIAQKKHIASQSSLINYNFFIGATPDNIDELNNTLNVCGIKIFMGSSTGALLVDKAKDIEHIFAHGRRLIAVHAEDEETIKANKKHFQSSTDVHDHIKIRSVEAAVKASTLALTLSERYQRRLHILHVSTAEEVDLLRRFKPKAPVSAEVCPQHFLLHAPEIYDRLGHFAQMNPPIREKHHGESLWKGLKEGVVDCMATDHAPHTSEEKRKPYGQAPSGMPGVETLLPLMLNRVNEGHCTLRDIVRWMCESPVRLYGVKNKGHIKVGYDADCVLVDMKKRQTIENDKLQTKVKWSPYAGWSLQGWPVMTFVHGQRVFCEGDFDNNARGKEILLND